MLGGLTIYPRIANFLQCVCAKNYENWLAVDKVIAKIIRLTFFGPPCTTNQFSNLVYLVICHHLTVSNVPCVSGSTVTCSTVIYVQFLMNK